MALGVDADLRPAFAKLLQVEGLDDLDRLTGSVNTFDEPPLSSRCDHIAFLKHLPVTEANTQLIRAAVEHLDRINAHLEAEPPRRVRRLPTLRLRPVSGSGGERSEPARPR
ncbi:immunity protein 15 of polymorphic toxin system, partial [Kineococcus xinjiangensis]